MNTTGVAPLSPTRRYARRVPLTSIACSVLGNVRTTGAAAAAGAGAVFSGAGFPPHARTSRTRQHVTGRMDTGCRAALRNATPDHPQSFEPGATRRMALMNDIADFGLRIVDSTADSSNPQSAF